MLWTHFLWVGLGLFVGFVILWFIFGRQNRAGWVDCFWSFGIGLSAIIFAVLSDGWRARSILIGGLGFFWSLRLCAHLSRRLGRGHEDGRYLAMEAALGDKYRLFMLPFFLIQSLLSWVCSLPFFVLLQNESTFFSSWEMLGLVIWAGGLFLTHLADRQLVTWKKDVQNSGKTCRSGLWSLSRHPNYFFEWLVWSSYSVMAFQTAGFFLCLCVSIYMFIMMRFISGVPWTEKQALRNRGDDYHSYQNSVPVFFPRFFL